MKLVNAEHLFAKRNVAIHFIEVVMNGFDKVGINLGGNFGVVKGGFKGVVVFSCFCKEVALFEFAIKGHCDGVFKIAEMVIIGFKGIFAKLAVCAFFKKNESAVGKNVAVALAVGYFREFKLGVAKGASDFVGIIGHFACGSKKSLFLFCKDVCGFSSDTVNIAAVSFKLGAFLIKSVEGLFGDSHDFRGCKSACGRNCNDNAHCFSAEILIGCVAHILVAMAACISVELMDTNGDFVVELPEIEKGLCGFAELALINGNLCGVFFKCFIFGEPSFVAFEDIFKVPGEFFRNFASFQNFLFCHFKTSVK